jgi:hypothetical protein
MTIAAQGDHKPNHDTHHDHDHHHGGGDEHRTIVITIAAPNNAAREFEVDVRDRVDHVARDAVRTFVNAHEMEPMECSLALVIHGSASLLDDAARLEETAVHEHSRLVLVPKQPKTDG